MRKLYSVVIIIVIAILTYRLSSFGKSDDAGPNEITRDSGTTSIETPRSAVDSRTDAVSNPFQQAAPIKNGETSTPPTVNDAATSDMGNSPTATPQESTVTGIETVAGPHGPFPAEPTSSNTSTEQSPVEITPPVEEPNTPRGPFGPFPTPP